MAKTAKRTRRRQSLESAKLCGVEPKAYLLNATRAALENPGTVTLPRALLTA